MSTVVNTVEKLPTEPHWAIVIVNSGGENRYIAFQDEDQFMEALNTYTSIPTCGP